MTTVQTSLEKGMLRGPLAFVEQPHAISADVRYSNGSSAGVRSIIETLGGGVALVDYDGDGITDIFATGGGEFKPPTLEGRASTLLRGDGRGQFHPVSTGIETSRYFSHGCWGTDYDNDGFTDVLVTGYGGLQLFRNMGDGTYRDAADDAGLQAPKWSTAAAWGDINGDGNLDLYVANYVDWSYPSHRQCDDPQGGKDEICGPKHYQALDDRLFLSHGDGTFVDVTMSAGLVPGGKGLGVIMGDIDVDGDIDVYVANDTTDNFLYLNRGDGTFDEVGQLNGAALDDAGRPTGSMGVDLGDFDNDGLPDLWTANYEHEIFGLYRNLGRGRFLHASRTMGFAAVGDRFVGWGTGFADFDHDGDLDVIATTGHVKRFPESGLVLQQPLVWLNDRGRYVRQIWTADSYLGSAHDGRGLALGDLDDDGDIDVVISHNDRPLAVLSNQSPVDFSWLRVKLVGRRGPRQAIGARVRLTNGSRTLWRQVTGGGSYLSQSDLRLHWGIPATEPCELQIHWPSGAIQTVSGLKGGTTVTLIEPQDFEKP